MSFFSSHPFFGDLHNNDISKVGPNASFSDAVNLFVAKPGGFPKFAAFIQALDDRGRKGRKSPTGKQQEAFPARTAQEERNSYIIK